MLISNASIPSFPFFSRSHHFKQALSHWYLFLCTEKKYIKKSWDKTYTVHNIFVCLLYSHFTSLRQISPFRNIHFWIKVRWTWRPSFEKIQYIYFKCQFNQLDFISFVHRTIAFRERERRELPTCYFLSMQFNHIFFPCASVCNLMTIMAQFNLHSISERMGWCEKNQFTKYIRKH